MRVGGATFGDRVAAAVERKRSQVLVGLDPRPELFPVELRGEPPAEASARFCRGIVDAVAPYVVGVKPQLAFFEALGPDGLAAFEEICAYARAAGLVVLADGKRGDIGSTARAYAAAYLEPREEGGVPIADALTVNPYLGRDSVEPYLAACRRHGSGIFCVVRTSIADRSEGSRKLGMPSSIGYSRLSADTSVPDITIPSCTTGSTRRSADRE